jgi:rhodanese-related sulfurtransferase
MANVKRVSPAEAKQLVDEGYLYLDVRTEPEYAAGHPAGAQNVPVMLAGPGGMAPNPDFLAVVEAAYPKDARLVVGCKAGGRSAKAAAMMVGAGYTNVIDQRAGFDGARDSFGQVTEPGWAPAGLPVEAATSGGLYAEVRGKMGTARGAGG